MASEDRNRVVHGSGDPAFAGSGSRSPDDREGAAGPSVRSPDPADPPDAPLPRHLAVTRRTPKPGQVRSVVSAGVLMFAVVALGASVVLEAVQRSGVPGLRQARVTAAPPRTTAASTDKAPAQRVLPKVGQPLVRDGGFEAGMNPGRDRPGTRCKRVAGGVASRWALTLRATGGGPGPPGRWLDLASAPTLGSRWHASVMVRGRPGQRVEIRLYERSSQDILASSFILKLLDTRWHRIAVKRAVERQGAVLGVDVRAPGLLPGQVIAIDDLRATRLP